MFRGIMSTIYVNVENKMSAKKIYNYLKKVYKKKKFIKFYKFNKPISTNDVINSNNCLISVCKSKHDNKIIILSAIDNLIKGAAGNAIQCMNIMFNINEDTGLNKLIPMYI